uniref:Telomerase activating protein Est1-like N-terminal domain-containing protein n=1 Tax=Anopheles epiroticus TaxID=199890 RepID=A0A182PL13_9DIPT
MQNATVSPTLVSSSAAPVSARSVSNKRQQQLYSPGSGPLRKTELTASNQSLNNQVQIDNTSRQRWGNEGSETLPSGLTRSSKQPCDFQQSSTDFNVSGSRLAGSVNRRLEGKSNHSNNHLAGEEMDSRGFSSNAPINRKLRDTRSGESRFVSGSKKHSIPSLSHLENLPPRLQKKTLQDLGLPPNYMEIMRAEQQQTLAQTLPNRNSLRHNRGRARNLGSSIGGGNGAYYSNSTYGAERSTGGNRPISQLDEDYVRPRSRSSEFVTGLEGGYGPRRSQNNREWKLETGPSSRNSSCDRKEVLRGTTMVYANDTSRKGSRFRQYASDNSRITYENLNGEIPSGSGYGNTSPFKSASQSCNSSERPYTRSNVNHRGNYRDTSIDRNFETGGRYKKHARDRYSNRSRECSLNRKVKDLQDGDDSQWRSKDGASPLIDQTDKAIAEMTKQFESSIGIHKGPGVLIIPSGLSSQRSDTVPNTGERCSSPATKLLYDPKNPSHPIVVKQAQLRISKQHSRDNMKRDETKDVGRNLLPGGPAWYNPDGHQTKLLRQKELIYRVVEADAQLQELMESGNLFTEWHKYVDIRCMLQGLLETFLIHEMRFAQDVNLEHHFWKLLFYGIIEQIRKKLSEALDEETKQYLQGRALEVVESGTEYFEKLLTLLEREFRFSLDNFIGVNAASSVKGLRYTLALVSSQKIFLFLGDLARYREQITEGHNFRKAKQWYVKAQQILPKNGRPYNQLALLSVYAFENNQRKREEKLRARQREREQRFGGNLRREIWIHPEGGSRVHRTGPLYPFPVGHLCDTSDEEELQNLCSIELNKRFIISFLHVLGKLITKTGMESFIQCAHQMLREFRVLMQYSPIAVTSYRLLQLMSLNMFAIEMTKLKDGAIQSGNDPSSLETRKLLRRKDELERKQRMQEKHNQRVQVSDTFQFR